MTDNITKFPARKPAPVSILWPPDTAQMEARGLSTQFTSAYRQQTEELFKLKADLETIRRGYLDLAEKNLLLITENLALQAEVERLKGD